MYKSTRPWRVLKVAGLGERVLRKKCVLVKDPTSDEMQDLAMNAMFTCLQNNAFGLSAPQLYKSVRMFVTRDYRGIPDPSRLSAEQHLQLPLTPYFNPRIESRSRQFMGEFEACLSDPWNVAFVARPRTIGISYIDGHGKYVEEELSGWHAQVFQHEYDHLDGKTLGDMCTQRGLYLTKKLYAKYEESSKKLQQLPEYETLVKASQLLNDGSYWGPEAEATISPEDVNIDALKIQMKLFLKQYGQDVDPDNISSDSFKDLVDRVIQERGSGIMNSDGINETAETTETLMNSSDGLEN